MPYHIPADMISLSRKGVKDEKLYETLVLTMGSLAHTLSNMQVNASSTRVS